MIQLHPKETFTIVRQIEDHTDSGTYYVQAVIRNAKTDALISTVNLDDKGNRRFTKNYIVPSDPSGEGLWISILTSVYTDSGYTTKSSNYADKMESYLVQARPVFNPNYPVPTGPDISYDKIKQIVDNVLKSNKEKNLDIQELTPLFERLNSGLLEINTILKSLNSKEFDLSPAINNTNNIGNKILSVIKGINIPAVDYEKISSETNAAISGLKEDIISTIKSNPLMSPSHRDEMINALSEAFDKNTEKYKKSEEINAKLQELVKIAKGEDDSEDTMEGEDDSKEEDTKAEDEKKKRISRLMQNK